MRYSRGIALVGVIIMLIGCNKPHNNDMKAQLDKIRAMVVQSTLISVQAVCSDPSPNTKLVDGALALLRRATAGPEMMRIHQMMGQMQMDKPGEIPKKSSDQKESPEQAMHIAVHAAGGDGFDLLDAMTRSPGLTCAQMQPVSLAATAALLRQHHEKAMASSADKILDKEVDTAAEKLGNSVQTSITDKTPEPVRILALALQKI